MRAGPAASESIFLTAAWLLLAGCLAAPELHPASDQKFTDFWPKFRAASLAEDTTRLERLTTFPFELWGTLNTKPAEAYDRAGFRRLAPRLLNQDSGLNEKGESMKKLLERTATAVGGSGRIKIRHL